MSTAPTSSRGVAAPRPRPAADLDRFTRVVTETMRRRRRAEREPKRRR